MIDEKAHENQAKLGRIEVIKKENLIEKGKLLFSDTKKE